MMLHESSILKLAIWEWNFVFLHPKRCDISRETKGNQFARLRNEQSRKTMTSDA